MTIVGACIALAATGCAAGSAYEAYGFAAPPAPPPADWDDGLRAPDVLAFQSAAVTDEERVSSTRRGPSFMIAASAVPASVAYDAYAEVAATSTASTVPAPDPSERPTPAPEVASDATRVGELRIYTGAFVLAVYDVQATGDAVLARIVALGGYLGSRTDTTLVVRVPAARFDEAVAAIGGAGQVLRRDVRVEEVTEAYRDLETRIRTLETMHARLAAMLERASNVQEALAVERELERVTVELESLRGRLRYLGDRIAFSTITLSFRALAPSEIPDADRPRALPFRWLHDLGLVNLLDL